MSPTPPPRLVPRCEAPNIPGRNYFFREGFVIYSTASIALLRSLYCKETSAIDVKSDKKDVTRYKKDVKTDRKSPSPLPLSCVPVVS